MPRPEATGSSGPASIGASGADILPATNRNGERRLAMAVAILALALLVLPGTARASLSWSGPFAIDQNGGNILAAVACPSSSQCIAVDQNGQAVTFNPGSPGSPTPTTID